MVLSTIYIFPIYDGNEEVLTIINEGGSRNDNVMNNENNAANMNINNNNNNSYNDNRTSFDTFYEKNQGHYYSSSESDKRRFYSKLIPRLAILISCAFLSFMIIIYLIRTIPDLSLPTSIQDVKNQTIILRDYSKNSWRGFLHILFVLSFIYIWKQAFSVPGALFLNILAGSIYGSANATLFTCLLTSTGASVAYLLSRFLGKPIADFYLSDKLIYLRKQVDENRENLFYYLLFVRLFPLSPWWFLNIASPLLLIPIRTFFITMFFGSIPYNFASCQSGEIISEINSTTDILQPILLFKLLLISLLTLVPPLLSKRIKFSNFSRLLKENKDYQKHMLLISSDQII